ncbi:sigma-54-dependent Fis family transcriptional regulator [candidate division WOR-3 bacterium]|nr:sigma-54-dependent Fis family transcriptional regulator [candidate division WOR-3 bacterium]
MRILVVDDEERFARLTAEHLKAAGYEAEVRTSGAEGVAALEAGGFDAVLTDLKMLPVDGMAVLEAGIAAGAGVMMMTAYGDVQTAVDAMRRGAADFITKPFDSAQLLARLERLDEQLQLRRENFALRRELAAGERLGAMVGSSPALKEVQELVARVAPSEATVLVLGESGTGKELVAREIHRRSRRADRPFVVVHAAAVPESLLESELFGYEKGAFTGAAARKAGRVESADGGTLFLDEIGEISGAFQVKLLRFLQERTFNRVGGTATLKVDTRIVAATNRDLQAEARAGRFREDLYYRLSVFPITVPPLRERKADIRPLAAHVLRRLGYGRELPAPVLELLRGHDWPGNVRELENVLERALILSGGGDIGTEHIQLPERAAGARDMTRVGPRNGIVSQAGSLADAERELVADALRRAGGNKSKAARSLGITRRVLYNKLHKLGMDGDED